MILFLGHSTTNCCGMCQWVYLLKIVDIMSSRA